MNLVPVYSKDLHMRVVDPGSCRFFGEFVTLKKNQFYISDALWVRIGMPDYIQFGMDRDEKVFGLKKTDEKDQFGLKCKMRKDGGAAIYGTTNVMNMISELMDIDFDNNTYRLTHGFVDSGSGYSCFRMDKGEKVPIKHRKKQTE